MNHMVTKAQLPPATANAEPALRALLIRLALLSAFMLLVAVGKESPAQSVAAGVPSEASGASSLGQSSASQYGNHYIILIDDSGDMSGYRDRIVKDLPRYLFEGFMGKPKEESLPGFDPASDQMSIIYFASAINDPRCWSGREKGRSVASENLFSWQNVAKSQLSNPARFADALSQWLHEGCRFQGNASPIATAQILVLPYLQRHLPADAIYRRTFVITISNDLFNLKVSPAYELSNLQRNLGLDDVDKASDEASQVSSLFQFASPTAWTKGDTESESRGRKPVVFYRGAEIKPLPSPESVLQYQANTSIDPQAVSSSRLRLALGGQENDLLIRLKNGASRFEFEPRLLEAAFARTQGGAWRVGETEIPRYASLALPSCGKPQCESGNDILKISFFETASPGLTFSPRDSEPDTGEIQFRVGFRYKNEVYDHLYAETRTLTIKVGAREALDLPGIIPLTRSSISLSDLTGEYLSDDNDGRTTQEEAKNRILARRSWYVVSFLLFACGIGGCGMFYLYQTGFHRRFKPRLEWHPVKEVIVNFDRHAASRMLVGTLEVVNDGELPAFGQLLKNREQPSRYATFQVEYNYFKKAGIDLLAGERPIGFVSSIGDQQLDDSLQEVIAHGKRIHLFLGADALTDFSHSAATPAQDQTFNVPLKVKMSWRASQDAEQGETAHGLIAAAQRLLVWLRKDEGGEINRDITSAITLKPEKTRKPKVTYSPAEGPIYFKKDREVLVGKFVFESLSEHRFAQPFDSDAYVIQTLQEHLPVPGEPIYLTVPRIVVPPQDRVEVPVFLRCDGQVVTNPEPSKHTYSFRLVGDFDAHSELGPHNFELFRDPEKADIILTISYPLPSCEVYWGFDAKTSNWQANLRLHGKAADGTLPGVDKRRLLLSERRIEFKAQTRQLYDLLTFSIGNSATSGNGIVEVTVTPRFSVKPGVYAGIRLDPAYSLQDLISVYDGDRPGITRVKVREGAPDVTLDVKIEPSLIDHIEGARTQPGHCFAEIDLEIYVKDDQGKEARKPLTLVIPVVLEKLPSANWLCIDFGTSAITAAFGTGKLDSIQLVPLQDLAAPGGTSLAQYDPGNSESGSQALLPSWIVCNADQRQDLKHPPRPGFPTHYAADLSMRPGEADFIGLPALSRHFEEDASRSRIIYSVKSWLARSAYAVPVRAPIPVREGKDIVNRKYLPLEAIIESAFAALAQGYLLADPKRSYHTDQIVLSHPNTFTETHVGILRDIGFRVFSRHLGVALPERLKLISESDAVSYFHCTQQMADGRRDCLERVLVYDFGAGTLDLSLTDIQWESRRSYPVGWRTVGRLGLPVAGNHFDELLARIIDRVLREATAGTAAYQYPVVSHNFADNRDEHTRAIMQLWRNIRNTKHQWDGFTPFTVVVGSTAGGIELVKEDTLSLRDDPPSAYEVGLWKNKETKDICLSIPSALIHEDEGIRDFVKFVTEEVMDELLHQAERPIHDVDTVVISGRGALWPGLRDRIKERFSKRGAAKRVYFPEYDAELMKEAVVRGAIARQDLLLKINSKPDQDQPAWRPRLGLLINHETELVPEEDWDEPVDLNNSPEFRLVQVNLRNPDRKNDAQTMRQYFYIDLSENIPREAIWSKDCRQPFIHKEQQGNRLRVIMENKELDRRISLLTESRAGEAPTQPPWPVGSVLLPPLSPPEPRRQTRSRAAPAATWPEESDA